jgi:hypothetical protein
MTSVLDTSWFSGQPGWRSGCRSSSCCCTELHHSLRGAGSYLARPIHLFATTFVPLGALLILLVKGTQVPQMLRRCASSPPCSVRCACSPAVGLNATLFQGAPDGSWRKRIPIDLPGRRAVRSDRDRVALMLLVSSGAPTSADCSPRWGSRRSCSAWPCRTPSGRSSPACSCCSSNRFRWATGSKRRRPWPCGRSQLACNAYRHRHRAADHAELRAGRRLLHQLQRPRAATLLR